MANNLKAIRLALGLTQPEMAEKMGTTKNQLIKLEKGDRRLTQEWIERAAKATGIPGEKFITENLDLNDSPPTAAEIAAARDLLEAVEKVGKLDEAKRYLRYLAEGAGDKPPPEPENPGQERTNRKGP